MSATPATSDGKLATNPPSQVLSSCSSLLSSYRSKEENDILPSPSTSRTGGRGFGSSSSPKSRNRHIELKVEGVLVTSLKEILDDPVGVKCFAAHLKDEFAHENIAFWRAIEDFRIKFKDGNRTPRSRTTLKTAARAIYKQYISEKGVTNINIEEKTRLALRRVIKEAKEKLTMFDEAQRSVYAMMSGDPLSRFLKSKYYERLVRARHARRTRSTTF
ncbi:hypothetical protein AAMO2058_001234800 [Amorphochlora amoebiformis]